MQTFEFNLMNKRPSLMFVECKSKEQSRRPSRVYEILNSTINKENEQPQQSKTIKKIDRTMGSINKLYQQTIQDKQNIQEQYCMLIEDLNAKLLQRAELIAQYEEMEELINFNSRHSNFEFQFAKKVERLDQQIQQLKRQSSFKLSSTTAELIRDRETAHKQLKDRIEQDTETAYYQYMEEQKESFENILSEYGNDLYQEVLQQQRQQIYNLISQQYNKKIQGIITVLRDADRLDQAIQQNIKYVDCSLSQDIYNIQQAMFTKKQLISDLQHNVSQNQDLTLKIEQSESQIINQQKAQEIYKHILTDSIHNQQQQYSLNNDKNKIQKPIITSNRQLDDSLHFSQLQFHKLLDSIESCIGEDSAKNSSVGPLSSDDSLLQHFNELNQSIIQCEKKKKTINLPLQKQDNLVENIQNDLLRLQTISEEQLSTKREGIKFQRTEEIVDCKQRLNFNKTKQTENTISHQSTDNSKIVNKTYQQPTFIQAISPQQPLLFNILSNPATVKNMKPQIFRFREQTYSEQMIKHQKSRSFDATKEGSKQKRLFSSNSSNTNGQQKQREADLTKQSQLYPLEQEILKIVKPLMQGILIYKKFSNKPNLTRQEYDPFHTTNPQVCGYGSRIMQLSITMDKLEFRNQMKVNQVDSQIQIESIMRTMIPKTILMCINIKRKTQDKFILQTEERQVLNIRYWPMSIVTQNEGRIELLFENEDLLEQWQIGLMFLKDNIKTLASIRKKVKNLNL